MGFALGGEQRAIRPNDLLKNGNAERLPKLPPERTMWVVMSVCWMPRVFATNPRPSPGSVLVDHISSLPSFQCAVAPCGSMVT